MSARLRPPAGRERPAAIGAVSLAMAALVIDIRMTQWALGPRFIVIGVISLLILAMGWSLVPPAGEAGRPYQSTLLIAGLLVLIFALQLLAEVLGAHHAPGAGGTFWTFAVEAGVAGLAAVWARSAGCTLIAALAAAISFLAFISFAFHPHGFGTFRWIILAESVVLAGVAAWLRRAHRRQAIQLVNVAGLLTLILALTFLAGAAIAAAEARLGSALSLAGIQPAGFGWKLYLVIATAALIGYAILDRAPAPGVLGTLVAFAFVVIIGLPHFAQGGFGLPFVQGGSLVGWPLVLLIVGVLGILGAFWRTPGSSAPAGPSGAE